MGGITTLNNWLGKAVSWLNLYMVLITFAIVVFRYAFGMGWVWLQELVLYLHATVFMVAAAFTFADDQHVKVDIFYANASKKNKAWVRLFGTLLFLIPTCVAIIYFSYEYVLNSWKVYEKSGDPNGLSGVYLLKTLILIYPSLLLLQGIVIISSSLKILRGEDG